MVPQVSSVMMSSPSPTNGAQDMHENLLCIGDAAFPGLSDQNDLNLNLNWNVILMEYISLEVPHFHSSLPRCLLPPN